MSFQLIYTSAERGLKSGSRGFTTVAMTEGMPAHCLQLCESMSGYVHVFELNSGKYEHNPVGWSHYRIKSGPNEYSVISRVSAHPKDYTGRTNKIAHHLMLEQPRELQSYANGPGDLLGSPFFSQEWSGAPHFLPEGQHPPSTQAKLDPQAGHWQAAGLPTSAAARISLALEQGTDSPIVLLFEAGANDDRVGLIQDILDLIPPSKRWEIGFSTYYSMHPTGADIHIRACAKGTDAARRAARHPRAVVVDLTNGSIEGLQHLPEADAALLSAATNGTIPEWAREPDPPAPQRQQEAAEEPEESPQLKPLPPPRPDRPGAVRKRKPPPPPGKAIYRNGAPPSKTPKELIGVLVGLLLLLSAGGLVLVTRDKSESPEQGGNNETDTEAVTPTPAPQGGVKGEPAAEEIAQDETSQPVPGGDSMNGGAPNSINGGPENTKKPEGNGDEGNDSAKAGGNSGEDNADTSVDAEGENEEEAETVDATAEENRLSFNEISFPINLDNKERIISVVTNRGGVKKDLFEEKKGRYLFDGKPLTEINKNDVVSYPMLILEYQNNIEILYNPERERLQLDASYSDENEVKVDNDFVRYLIDIHAFKHLNAYIDQDSKPHDIKNDKLTISGLRDHIKNVYKNKNAFKNKKIKNQTKDLAKFNLELKELIEQTPPEKKGSDEDYEKKISEFNKDVESNIKDLIKDIFKYQNDEFKYGELSNYFTDKNTLTKVTGREDMDFIISLVNEKNIGGRHHFASVTSAPRPNGFEDVILRIYSDLWKKTQKKMELYDYIKKWAGALRFVVNCEIEYIENKILNEFDITSSERVLVDFKNTSDDIVFRIIFPLPPEAP